MKTCEEYVLNELENLKEEKSILMKKIEEFNEKEKTNGISNEDMKCIYLSDKPNYYYYVNIKSEYDWNKFLSKNDKTPELVEAALKDDEKLKELCELEKESDYHGTEKLMRIEERVYNYLIKASNDRELALVTTTNDISTIHIGKDYNTFLSKEEAEKNAKKYIKSSIEYYLKHYKKDYKDCCD